MPHPKSLTAALIRDLIESEKPGFYISQQYVFVRFSLLPLYHFWRKKNSGQSYPITPWYAKGSLPLNQNQPERNYSSLYWIVLQIPSKIIFPRNGTSRRKKDILHYFSACRNGWNWSQIFSAELPSDVSTIEKKSGQGFGVYLSRASWPIKNISFFPGSAERGSGFHPVGSVYLWWSGGWKLLAGCQAKDSIATEKHIRVTYYGPLPHAEVMAALGANHIFVLPTFGEKFWVMLFLNPFSAGRPVLISN